MEWITPLAILLSLLFIGFFAGIEIAFVSANKLSIELRRKQGTYSGKTWGRYADEPARFIGSTLIGFNLVLVVYGLLWSDFMAPLWNLKFWKQFNTDNPYIRLMVETLFSTFMLLLFEFIFKALFRAKNDSVLSNGIITWITNVFFGLLSGVATLFVEMAEWVLRYIFNVKLNEKKDAFSKIDLENIVNLGKHYEEDNAAEINKELFENALQLSETKVRACLIHRREIEAIELGADIQLLKQKFIATKLSKLVVYENNIDNIVGYVHQLDMFKNPAAIKDILLPIPLVPESMSATDMMNKFSKEHKSIAWVVDEFGGTAGIVTMEDLLEEIFGEIKDEYDTEELIEKQLSATEFIFSGRLELDYISEKYKLSFADADATETLSGFIIKHRDEIPRQKETFINGNYQFDILNVSDTRIETVKMKLLK
jgi:CBS domain containing-hemolysin-like protein